MTWHRSIPVDTPTRSGHVYPRAVARQIALEATIKGTFAFLAARTLPTMPLGAVSLDRICGHVFGAKIEDGYLYFDIVPTETPHGDILTALLAAGIELTFNPLGCANIDENDTVGNYSLICVDVDVNSKA